MVSNAQGSNRFLESVDELNSSMGYDGDLAFIMDNSGDTPKITSMFVKNGSWIKVEFGSSNESSDNGDSDETKEPTDPTTDENNENNEDETVETP